MLKKIQRLSLALVTCVSTASLAQTSPQPKNQAVLTPTLEVVSKRTFGTLPKTTLSLKHDDPTKSDFVEIDITGNTAAKLDVKSDKGALISGTDVVIAYELKVAVGAQEKTTNLDSLGPKTMTPMVVSDTDSKLKVTATVQGNQNPPAGTYSDTVTLTLQDV